MQQSKKMRWLVFLYLVSSVNALLTYKPNIVDTYYVDDARITRDNPYFNGSETVSSLIYEQNRQHTLNVYDLDRKVVKTTNGVVVECYDSLHCDTTLNDVEQRFLSLYASMVESSGYENIGEEYSIGLIRDKTKEGLMGRFTKAYTINQDGTFTTLHMTFWIRLTRGFGNDRVYVYSDLTEYPLTLAMMELSLHERAHYDVTNYDPEEGHCDWYQAWYNSLIHKGIRKLEDYKKLTLFIVQDAAYSPTDTSIAVIWIVIVCVLLVAGVAIYCLCAKKEAKKPTLKLYFRVPDVAFSRVSRSFLNGQP